ncbi:hypothetical protein G3A_18275 [Bacillus sp. 17376]|uniref:Uncharacterized protein n=1 Tax=Mesobacillus boroniphilus JCM 21738 TaxID=1294265 RepID=W4RUH9_9BACI|nr:hypothetical protein [Mesobacillus boroniphilus]ESU31106.1 hypothetical protein G3A_18275 [Bacillus sp. 17376]GAE47941.1 hypothetical protein JCM21738_4987 [Mesobacillus boroniphilus JCM 21738]
MYRYFLNTLLILAIGAGFYFYVQLIFSKVTDPLYGTLALLAGCLFAAGISRELLLIAQSRRENSQI